MTREEYIRQLHTWELGEFIMNVYDHKFDICNCDMDCKKCNKNESGCTSEVAEWLKGEME